MSFMVNRDFQKGSQNQHFQNTLLVGREAFTNKSSLCTLLIILTILDDSVPSVIYLQSFAQQDVHSMYPSQAARGTFTPLLQ